MDFTLTEAQQDLAGSRTASSPTSSPTSVCAHSIPRRTVSTANSGTRSRPPAYSAPPCPNPSAATASASSSSAASDRAGARRRPRSRICRRSSWQREHRGVRLGRTAFGVGSGRRRRFRHPGCRAGRGTQRQTRGTGHPGGADGRRLDPARQQDRRRRCTGRGPVPGPGRDRPRHRGVPRPSRRRRSHGDPPADDGLRLHRHGRAGRCPRERRPCSRIGRARDGDRRVDRRPWLRARAPSSSAYSTRP